MKLRKSSAIAVLPIIALTAIGTFSNGSWASASSSKSKIAQEFKATYQHFEKVGKGIGISSIAMTSSQKSQLVGAVNGWASAVKAIDWPSSLSTPAAKLEADIQSEANALNLVPTGGKNAGSVFAALEVAGQAGKAETKEDNVLRKKLGLKPEPKSSSSSGSSTATTEPVESDSPSAETVKGWAAKFCSVQPGVPKATLLKIMGTPSSSFTDQADWDGFEWHLSAFYDVNGNIREMDIDDIDLTAADKALITCALSRTEP